MEGSQGEPLQKSICCSRNSGSCAVFCIRYSSSSQSVWSDLTSVCFETSYKLASLDQDKLNTLHLVYLTLYAKVTEALLGLATLYKLLCISLMHKKQPCYTYFRKITHAWTLYVGCVIYRAVLKLIDQSVHAKLWIFYIDIICIFNFVFGLINMIYKY